MVRRSAKISRKRSPPKAVASIQQSKRLKADGVLAGTKAKGQAQNVKSTSRKSKYFEPQTTSDSDEDEDHENESGYEDDNAVIASTSAEPEGEDSSEEDRKPKMRRAKVQLGIAGNKSTLVAKPPTSRELLKEGVKTGLGPGKEVRIRLPKAREAGDIPYHDDRLHPNTFLFLKDLAQNNDRDWLKRKTYPSLGTLAEELKDVDSISSA
jgi:hypothetical protein